MTEKTAENLSRILECPVCLDEFGNKEVFQCPNGHTVCSNCVSKCPKCPTCRGSMPRKRIRNRALEFFASKSGTLLAAAAAAEDSPQKIEVPVTVTPSEPPPASTKPPLPKRQNRSVVHEAFCDGPNCKCRQEGEPNAQKIHGIRYKCVICEDFDLCENCRAAHAHKHHPFMAFKTTKQFEKYEQQQLQAQKN